MEISLLEIGISLKLIEISFNTDVSILIINRDRFMLFQYRSVCPRNLSDFFPFLVLS